MTNVVNAGVPLAVHDCILGKVLGWCYQTSGYFLYKLLPRHICPQGIVEFFLIAQSAHGFFGHFFAAGRTRPVTRIDNHAVGQRHNLVAEAVEQEARQILATEI